MDESQQNRTSDAAATRKRRSSILKCHRPPRAPFSELEFNVTTPTDTTKSRRVSFSRRTGVAEFVTNEATTTWKNVYEEHNKTAESSGNESEMNPPRATVGHLGRGLFEQHFQEAEAVDLISTSWTRGHVETSINNINFDQQIASLECFDDRKLTAPYQNFEMTSLTNCQSKIFSDDLIVSGMGEITDRISVNFSVVQPIGMSKTDELDAIQRDIRNAQSQGLSGNVIGPGPGPFGHNFSEYIEIDLNTTHAAIKNEESITYTTHNSKVEDVSKSNPSFVVENKILDKDWVANKENILINPYIAPNEASNFALNEECDKILVFDGKRLTIQCEKETEPTNHVPTHFTSEEKLQRKTLVLNPNDDLPDVIDEGCLSMLQGTSRYFINGKDDKQNDMSMSQALDDDLEINSNKRKTIVYDSYDGDISVTQAIPSKIILDGKTMSPHCKTLSGSQSDNVSLQPFPKTISPGSQSRPSRRNTILYEDDAGQKSLTRDLPLINIEEKLLLAKESEKGDFSGKRRTIVFETDSADISITQAIPSNLVLTDKSLTASGKRKTIVFEDEDGNVSLTQAVPANNVSLQPLPKTISPGSQSRPSRRNTILYEDDAGGKSLTRDLPSNLLIAKESDKGDFSGKRRTIVFEADSADISITQAIPSNLVLTDKSLTASGKRKTMVFEEEAGNVSLTQAVPANNVSLQPLPKTISPGSQSRPCRRNTIVYENDAGQKSLTRDLPSNLLLAKESEKGDISGKRRTIVFEADSADISITQAIPSNLFLTDKSLTAPGKRKTMVFEEEAGNVSLTQAVPANLIFSNKGNISLTQIVPSDLILPQKCTSMLDRSKTVNILKYCSVPVPNPSPPDNDGNISITQVVPSNIILSHEDLSPDRMRTVVYESKNSDISITQPVGSNFISYIKNDDCKIESQIKAVSIISEKEINNYDKSETEYQERNSVKEIIETENVDTTKIKADDAQSVSFESESKKTCSNNIIELPVKAASVISEREIGELDETSENVQKEIAVKDVTETESVETTKINDEKAKCDLIKSDSKNTFSTQSSFVKNGPSDIESDSTLANGNIINHTDNDYKSQCSTSTSFSIKLKENVHEVNVSMSEASYVCEQINRLSNVLHSPYEKKVDVSMSEAGDVCKQKNWLTHMRPSPYDKEVDVSMTEAGDICEQKSWITNVPRSPYEKKVDVSMSEAGDVCEQKNWLTYMRRSPYEKEVDVSMTEAGDICEQKSWTTNEPRSPYEKEVDILMSEACNVFKQKDGPTNVPHGSYKNEVDVSMSEAGHVCEQKYRPTNVPPCPHEKSPRALIKNDSKDVQFQVEKDKSVDGKFSVDKDKSGESLFYAIRDSAIPEPVSPNVITKHTKTVNDTNDILDLISELTDREEENNPVTEVQSRTEITARDDTLGIKDISNVAEGRVSLLPKRLSTVLSREDLMNNISMAQAVLQKSRAEIEVSEVMDDTIITSTACKNQIDHATQSKKMVQVSSEVVKKLHFEEDLTFNEDSCCTSKFQGGVSPVKKTAFGEKSYTRDNKANVIPTYLKDMSDGIEQLKSDLVKPTGDTLTFETVRVDKVVRQAPSTASFQVQANHKASNPEDLTESESAPKIRRSSFSNDKEESVDKIIQCIPEEQMYKLKSASVMSLPLLTSSFARRETDRILVFDHNSPVSNVLLAPINVSEVHLYNPVRCQEAVNETSEQATLKPTDNKKSDKDICIKSMMTERECYTVKDIKATSVAMQCDAQESDYKSENKSMPESVSVNKSFCSDYNSGLSNSPQSLNQSIGAMAVEIKDTKVNTAIIMRSTEKLQQNISSLTLMDDTVSRSRHLATTGNTRPIHKIDEREKHECLQNTEYEHTSPDRERKFSSDQAKQLDKSKGHKRVHGPEHKMNHKNCTLESLEVTPKPACKIQKINYISPTRPSGRQPCAREYDSVTSESERGKESRSGSRSPSSQKRSPRKFKLEIEEQDMKLLAVSAQHVKTECNIDSKPINMQVFKKPHLTNVSEESDAVSQAQGSERAQLASARCDHSEGSRSRVFSTDWQPQLLNELSSNNLFAECESGVNVVSKIDSSKDLVAECKPDFNVITKIDSSKNLVAECEPDVNVVTKIDSYKNLVAECESDVNVFTKIDSSKNLVAECEPDVNVVTKIDSSKNLVAECEPDVNVVTKIGSSKNLVSECEPDVNVVTKIGSSKNLVSECEPDVNVVTKIDSSKNLVAECESDVNVVAKIDKLSFMGSHECAWKSASSDTWVFKLLRGRLHMSVRLAHRHDILARTFVRSDTPVLHVQLELDRSHENKNPVEVLCARFAEDAMRNVVRRDVACAGEVPALLCACASVARVALQWSSAMDNAYWHLAFSLSEDGRLELNVANVPLRSVWKVSMRVAMLLEEGREKPCPCASDVDVTVVVSDYPVSTQETALALQGLPYDWGHVPRTVWRIFRYLKNLKSKSSDKDFLLLSKR